MADLAQTAANVQESAGAITEEGVAGEALVAGNWVARDPVSGQLKKVVITDADLHKCVGMVVNSAPGVGQKVDYVRFDKELDVGGTLTVGTLYGPSSLVDGNMAPVADQASGDYPGFYGIAEATNKLKMLGIQYGDVAIP